MDSKNVLNKVKRLQTEINEALNSEELTDSTKANLKNITESINNIFEAEGSLKGSLIFKADTKDSSLGMSDFSDGINEFVEFVASVADDVITGNEEVSEDLGTKVSIESVKAIGGKAQVQIDVVIDNLQLAKENVAKELDVDVDQINNKDVLDFVGESISLIFDEAEKPGLYEIQYDLEDPFLVTKEEADEEYGETAITGEVIDVSLTYKSATVQ